MEKFSLYFETCLQSVLFDQNVLVSRLPPNHIDRLKKKKLPNGSVFCQKFKWHKKTSKCLCICTWDWLVNTSEAPMGCRYQFILPAEWPQMSPCWKRWANAPLAVVLNNTVGQHENLHSTPIGKITIYPFQLGHRSYFGFTHRNTGIYISFKSLQCALAFTRKLEMFLITHLFGMDFILFTFP